MTICTHSNPIWHDEHEYRRRENRCRRKYECRRCGELAWGHWFPCLGNGDGELCLEMLLTTRKH